MHLPTAHEARLPQPDLEAGAQIDSPEAFREVFRVWYEPLLRYACRFTRDLPTAHDVLQDVFATLWEQRARLTITVSLRALLYTMVRNRALKTHRRRRFETFEVAPDPRVSASSDDAYTADQLQHHLTRWIDALPPRRKEAFTLSRYHHLRHSEIATIMGVSERTVDTHILLALRELRHRLDVLHNEPNGL